jgi:integrase/recombinase XerD
VPPNTLRAVAFDLRAFFLGGGERPRSRSPPRMFDFLADSAGTGRYPAGGPGVRLSARTIARRLSSVSGLYAYLVAR